ncbi:GxxExxY protein [Draconibacterium orientale]|jgi:GxxExxY protein|uniref:GxxExxY protein n=1 Tax=Draconibacterium orientale TaxID=1168034 RepID=A0A1I0GV94_9BACT|nr:GxxExxY protein [Draconibacterium orientale]SET75290.1 GxxExxY protein [Draconibacterium orientale]
MISKTEIEKIGKQIVDAAFEVHSELGPGLLESVYEICLVEELKERGLTVERQVKLPVVYKDKILQKEFIIDILVEKCVIIELKAVEMLLPVHEVQTLTYMKLADMKLGYLINFNVPLIKQGIKRKINGYF